MITKGLIKSISASGNRCIVRMPIFENASSSGQVTAEAIVSITPGFYNNLFVNDVVLVAFEENALEKPVILGKLYVGGSYEFNTKGGAGIVDALVARTSVEQPGVHTTFVYPSDISATYKHFTSPRKIADYILWLEELVKKLAKQLDANFKCLKSWVQFQLKAENVEVDDGNIDTLAKFPVECQYQTEGKTCEVCSVADCVNKGQNSQVRVYTTPSYNDKYDSGSK